MMKTFLFIILFISCATQSFAQSDSISGNYRLNGIVKDQEGAVFAGLNLYIRKGNDTRTFSTNINGEFEIGLQPGEYEITVNKIYADSFRAFITIQAGSLNPDNLVFVLDSRRICCNNSTGIPYPKILAPYLPPYPPAAMAVRATGEVIVNIQIDKDGTVTSAKAEAGHPLLTRTSEVAAERFLFESSNANFLRSAKLTFVYLYPVKVRPDLNRYANSYRYEIIGQAPTVDYSSY